MNKKNKSLIIASIILVVLLLIVLPKVISSEEDGNDANNQGKMVSEIPVTAHVARFEKLSNNVYTTGTILANEEVELKSEISGKIVQIAFNEGTFVKKGCRMVKFGQLSHK